MTSIPHLVPPRGERVPADPLTAPSEGPLLAYRSTDYGPYPHVIPDLLPVGACLLWARPGIGKSMLALQMEMAVACDRVIAGWHPGQPSPVLVVDFEAGFTQTLAMTHRVAEWLSLPADEDTAEGERLRTMIDYRSGIDGQSFAERMITLQGWLEKARAAGSPYQIVRVDTLGMLMGNPPAGYNAYEWASEAVGALNRLALEYRCAVVIIHHPNKMGDVSGSTGIEGKATISWKVERNPSESEGLLKCSKNRVGAERSWKMYFDLQLGRWEFEESVDTAQAVCTGVKRRILDLLADRGPLTGRELRLLMPDVRAGTGKEAMSRLRDKGWIYRDAGGYWKLVSPPRPVPQPEPLNIYRPSPQTGEQDNNPAYEGMHPDGCTCQFRAEDEREERAREDRQEQDDNDRDDRGSQDAEDSGPQAERCQSCGELVTGADGHPDCQVAPGAAKPRRWDSFGAMRRCLEASRMHPVWFIPRTDRDSGPWPAAILADQSVEAGFRWVHPDAKHHGGGCTVMPYDRSQSFTSACSSVPVAAGLLRHTGPLTVHPRVIDEHGLAGIARVVAPPPLPGLPHPLGRRAVPGQEIWVPSGQLETLWKLHDADALDRPVVTDSWLGRRVVGLFDPFAEAVREARAQWENDPEMTAAVKRSASTALRCLYPAAARSPWWRPDWRAAVVGEAATRLWMKAYRAVEQGADLLHMGNVDQVTYLLPPGGDPLSWYPPGYAAGSKPGTYHWGATRYQGGCTAGMTAAEIARTGEVSISAADPRITVIKGPVPLRVWLQRRG